MWIGSIRWKCSESAAYRWGTPLCGRLAGPCSPAGFGPPSENEVILWMDELHFAPPQNPWKDGSPVSNKCLPTDSKPLRHGFPSTVCRWDFGPGDRRAVRAPGAPARHFLASQTNTSSWIRVAPPGVCLTPIGPIVGSMLCFCPSQKCCSIFDPRFSLG